MNTYDEAYTEDLINEDLSAIENSGARSRREYALRKYYSNPNYCRNCGLLIHAEQGKKISETTKKIFCNHTCAAIYNNSTRTDGKFGPESILSKCNDDIFIKAYNNSSNYKQLGLHIGYSYVNSEIRKKIKERIDALGLEQYEIIIDRLDITQTTKGELINKRSNWQSWRSTIQKNARDTYNKSNKPKHCVICGYDKTYDVAHIKAVSDFDDDVLVSEINNIDNLISLCPNHHWEFDHGQLNINEYVI